MHTGSFTSLNGGSREIGSALIQKWPRVRGQDLRRRIENPVLEVGQFDQRRTVYELSVGPGGFFQIAVGVKYQGGLGQ